MTLEDLTRIAASRFLSTVLLVDENMDIGPRKISDGLVTPGLQAFRGEPPADSSSSELERDIPIEPKGLVEAFAAREFFATPYRPDDLEDEEFLGRIEGLAHRADIVVLDWNLYGDDGRRSLALAERLAGDDRSDRVRIIVFYTGQEPDHVQEALAERLGLPEFDESGRSSDGWLHVFVLVKAESTTVDKDDPRLTEPDALPDRLIEAFASQMSGILPTVAIAGLAAIRESEYKVLKQFSAFLDPGFLGHRSLLPSPEEAAEQLPELLADELRAILEHDSVAEPGGLPVVLEWLQERSSGYEGYVADFKLKGEWRGVDWMMAFHERGYPTDYNSRWDTAVKPTGDLKGALKRTPARLHDPPDDKGTDDGWAHLMTIRTNYFRQSPILRLGSIVADESREAAVFMLCLKPHCDAVRLQEVTPFAFLPLERADTKPFGLVVRYQDAWVRLRVPKLLEGIKTLEFEPTNGSVRATVDGGGQAAVFPSNHGDTLVWLGDLRHDLAHSIVQDVANHAARIGLSGSEWLRVNAKGR